MKHTSFTCSKCLDSAFPQRNHNETWKNPMCFIDAWLVCNLLNLSKTFKWKSSPLLCFSVGLFLKDFVASLCLFNQISSSMCPLHQLFPGAAEEAILLLTGRAELQNRWSGKMLPDQQVNWIKTATFLRAETGSCGYVAVGNIRKAYCTHFHECVRANKKGFA